MLEVGVRALKNRLSEYLRRASAGERIVVTDRGRPVAAITGVEEGPAVRAAWDLVRLGHARWSGGKPAGSPNPPEVATGDRAQLSLEADS